MLRSRHSQASPLQGRSNDAPIGGLKVVAKSSWFAARPSGTEDIDKIYGESFDSQAHLHAIVSEAQNIVNDALGSAETVSQEGFE